MTHNARDMGWPVAVVAGAALIGLGVAIGAGLWRSTRMSVGEPDTTQPAALGAPVDHSLHGATPAPAEMDATVTLTPDMVARAGITTVRATIGSIASPLRLPGSVSPNEYKTSIVTSVVSGRISAVHVELGQRVSRGQALASIYSPELSEAQAAYVGLEAELAAHEQRLGRAQRLETIGAVARQEVEEIESTHTRILTMLDSARARLRLLGATVAALPTLAGRSDPEATVTILSPMSGVVLERNANPGVNIDPSTALFKVTDLDTVWVVANIYERDASAVHLGMAATVISPANPDLTRTGKVSYIDPRVQESTRTAQIRVETRNPGGQLRLGTYVEVVVDTGTPVPTLLIPRAAVQARGATPVVYVASGDQPGHYVERQITVGRQTDDLVEVLGGVSTGEMVVTEGAFFLRAERERGAATSGGPVDPHRH